MGSVSRKAALIHIDTDVAVQAKRVQKIMLHL